ncbi:MAG: N-formylglutamate amidohydrolase [Methylovirgula sp.]
MKDARDAGVLLLCDHASNALPQSYGTLGMAPADLAAHIGYDIGAADLTRRLAAQLGAPALLTRFRACSSTPIGAHRTRRWSCGFRTAG